jgi:hypothetical protein
MLLACQFCGGPVDEGEVEFLDLRRPVVTVVGVPALVCGDCGGQVPRMILTRLEAICGAAAKHAIARGLEQVHWAFTTGGPPEVGGMPGGVRESFEFLRLLVQDERRLKEATVCVASDEPPIFH